MPILLAGIPQINRTLFHRIQFPVGDSAAWIHNLKGDGKSLLFVRDIEVHRAQSSAKADEIVCAADFAPSSGLSGDRDTALAQAVSHCLALHNVTEITTDRTLPFLFAWHIQNSGIHIHYDENLGVIERRVKSMAEVNFLKQAQKITTEAMILACEMIARAKTSTGGYLTHNGNVLTSETVRSAITRFLIDHQFSTPSDSIVAALPHSADCHHFGTGPLKTGIPIIVDIFPRDNSSFYNGDCTRTVVHGTPSDRACQMHEAVVQAKKAACMALKPGSTGDAIHQVTIACLQNHGFPFHRGTIPPDEVIPSMCHGTGHGIGLDVHEPILLDSGGSTIMANEVFTV
ncbi:MAG: M24 family metallopeptidase, partial [Verrucomicrobia bacterium]|nr:M24 family metallopeptidase [Verrucomicrobiota bacterium]